MAEFLLIHGSCHGAWCWRDVLPFLNNNGCARAIDLPAHGQDATPANQATLPGYARAILDAIDDPVILVGHSMAGFPITLAAELAPEKIRALVYVCAYVPRPGLSLGQMRKAGPRQPLAPAIRLSQDRITFSFDPALAGEKFYHDCPPDTLPYATGLLCPEPVLPQETPLAEVAKAASLPRFYIHCTEDQAIPPEYQATMAADFAPAHVIRMATSHSPFFAAPQALAGHLQGIAESL
jgi:pimeloyl-ACP methyl ester carboxylesterase